MDNVEVRIRVPREIIETAKRLRNTSMRDKDLHFCHQFTRGGLSSWLVHTMDAGNLKIAEDFERYKKLIRLERKDDT